MKRLLWLALAAAVLAPVGAAAAPTEPPAIVLNPVADGFSDPLTLTHAGDDRLFVVENAGLIRIVEGDGTVLPTPFLDISDKTSTESERGLLGLAFHPDYAANGTFFIYYTGLGSPTFDSIVARYTVSAGDPNVANPDSEVIVLTEPQNRDNHNGGQMAFGPDGYLYIALGDGGGGGDPDQNAQDVTTLKGTITRIDVDGTDQGDGLPEYDIPPDNPDLSGVDPDYRPEICAYGLRNPWRFSFDSLTGDLY
ncbi:MAG: PQQ-dependent sugar dehydrogenase, partial [Chloroflexi bacterium]|nr:PQQ-dependent sugar dehydrogenase [Chloroflexota bacterium]